METDIRAGNIEAEMKKIKDDLLKALAELKEGLFADTFAASKENEVDVPGYMNTPDRCDGEDGPETDRHFTDSQENPVSPAKIRDFANWAAVTSAELGYEQTLTLLEISAMMGYMPDSLKSVVEKCVPRSGPGTVYTRNMAGYQIKALKTLGSLLETKEATDIVMLRIAASAWLSYNWPDPDCAPDAN